MAEVDPGELTTAAIAKLYGALTKADGVVPAPEDTFFCWSTSGLPLKPADLEALADSASRVRSTAGTDEDRARARRLAVDVARLLDFRPDPSSMNSDQFARLATGLNQELLPDVYRYVLTSSQVVKSEPPPDVIAKVERLRGLLQVRVTERDIVSDAEREVIRPSALMKAYQDKQRAYAEVAMDRANRQVQALVGTDPAATQYWAVHAKLLEQREQNALNDWITNGYKNDVEQIEAFISQVQDRDQTQRKSRLLAQLDASRFADPLTQAAHYPTSLGIAPDFATSPHAWRPLALGADEVDAWRAAPTNAPWPVRPGPGFVGVFTGGSERRPFTQSVQSADGAIAFEYAEVSIVRPWFDPTFFTSNTWRFDRNNPSTSAQLLSNGNRPPQGLLPGYPTTAVFVRGLSLSLGESRALGDLLTTQCSPDAPISYLSMGPFFLGGSATSRFSADEQPTDWGYQYQKGTLAFTAPQLVGFRCRVLRKSPLPDVSVADTDWV